MLRDVSKLFAVGSALLLLGAGTASSVAAAQVAAGVPGVAPSDYHLGTADQVQVNVFNEPTLSGTFPVASDGTVALPLVGNIPASGSTAVELKDAITAALADGYLKDPKVSVSVLTFRPFYILGEVNKPGEYPYATGMTVAKAVATAGGYTYRANERTVFIKRATQSSEERVPYSADLVVEPGDTLRIAERYF
jgi:polysaccharide export outer membrane protein